MKAVGYALLLFRSVNACASAVDAGSTTTLYAAILTSITTRWEQLRYVVIKTRSPGAGAVSRGRAVARIEVEQIDPFRADANTHVSIRPERSMKTARYQARQQPGVRLPKESALLTTRC